MSSPLPRRHSNFALAGTILAGICTGATLVALTCPELRSAVLLLLRIIWLYVVTGMRS